MVRRGVPHPDGYPETEEAERRADRCRALANIREALAPVEGLIEEYGRRSEDGTMAMFLRDSHRQLVSDLEQAVDYEEMDV